MLMNSKKDFLHPHVQYWAAFAAEIGARVDFPIEVAASAEEVMQNADVLIYATASTPPLFLILLG